MIASIRSLSRSHLLICDSPEAVPLEKSGEPLEIMAARPSFPFKYVESRYYRNTVYNNTFTQKRTLSQHFVAKSALHQHTHFAMLVRIPSI